MFNKNDYIIYGGMSVCQVMDIIEEDSIYSKYKTFYVLQPVYADRNATIIKVPVDNTKVFMRPILSKEEVLSLISDMNKTEDIWIDDYRERNQEFKSIIKNNVPAEIAQLVRNIYINKEDKESEGKKLTKSDEEIMKSAEKLIEEEFAISLGIEVGEVLDFILNHVPDKK